MTEADLAECAELVAPASDEKKILTPWVVATVEKYNECAKGKETVARKIREHNKKSKEQKQNESSLEARP